MSLTPTVNGKRTTWGNVLSSVFGFYVLGPIFGVLLGMLTGFIFHYLFGSVFYDSLAVLGITGVPLWKLGGVWGFIVGSFRNKMNVDTE